VKADLYFIGEVLDLAGARAGYVDVWPVARSLWSDWAQDFVAELRARSWLEDAVRTVRSFVVTSGMVVAAVDVGDDDVGVVLDSICL